MRSCVPDYSPRVLDVWNYLLQPYGWLVLYDSASRNGFSAWQLESGIRTRRFTADLPDIQASWREVVKFMDGVFITTIDLIHADSGGTMRDAEMTEIFDMVADHLINESAATDEVKLSLLLKLAKLLDREGWSPQARSRVAPEPLIDAVFEQLDNSPMEIQPEEFTVVRRLKPRSRYVLKQHDPSDPRLWKLVFLSAPEGSLLKLLNSFPMANVLWLDETVVFKVNPNYSEPEAIQWMRNTLDDFFAIEDEHD